MTSQPLVPPGTGLATIGKRVGAFAIDQVAVLLLYVLLVVVLGGAVVSGSAAGMLLAVVAYLLVPVGYGLALWVWLGRSGLSPGNKALGLRVVSEDDGAPLGLGRAFVRQLVLGLLFFLTFGVAPMVMAVLAAKDSRRQAWHDKAARSVVLDLNAARAVVEPPRQVTAAPAVVSVALPAAAAPLRAAQVPLPTAPAASVETPAAEPPLVAPRPVQRPPAPSSRAETGLISAVPGLDAAPPAPAVDAADELDDDAEHTRMTPVGRGRQRTRSWRLDLGDRVVEVTGAGLIGRSPEPRAGEPAGQLVEVDDPGRSVSKTHLQFGVDEDGFWVADRGSTNGSRVVAPAGPELTCVPGQRIHVPAGSTLVVGEHHIGVSTG